VVRTKQQQRLQRSNREKSGAHEKRVAKKLGARLTPNSGAGHIKGDIQTKEYLIEHKFTDKGQFILFLDMLMKTDYQAFCVGKKPKWIITIRGQDFTLFGGIL